jgi:hypothetical protein
MVADFFKTEEVEEMSLKFIIGCTVVVYMIGTVTSQGKDKNEERFLYLTMRFLLEIIYPLRFLMEIP